MTDFGKQTSLTDSLCSAILNQKTYPPTETEWIRIRSLAEKVQEEKDALNGHYSAEGMDFYDRMFLKAMGGHF
ncbi:MAG: hypothetical protein K8I29_19750 [Alphaproteobacteria bacterium]|uniref:Uncharacterized protein n=1 Tax=Candidatus Nitrobium versatile TaxID=2884831 RepID=A0A953M3R6_9BACT|nr:hypothetical protein [Candidatus Nitrobium versatile]